MRTGQRRLSLYRGVPPLEPRSSRAAPDLFLDTLGREVHRSAWAARVARLRANGSSLIYLSLLGLLSLLPWRLAFTVATWIGRVRYLRHRADLGGRAALMELRLDAESSRVPIWLRRTFELAVLEDLECWLLPRHLARGSLPWVQFEAAATLDDALAAGRGLVLYSGHVWSIHTLIAALLARGYPVNVTKRERVVARHNWVERRFYARRTSLLEKYGARFLWTEPPNPFVAAHAAAALRRNEVVLSLVDARSRHDTDVDVAFLGALANFPPGPALLARVSGAPLVGAWLHRSDDNSGLIARIGPPTRVSGDHRPAVSGQAAWIEAEIRRDPPSWAIWLFPFFRL